MVFADRTDKIAGDCEVVAKNTPGGFRFTGSQSADRISPPYGWGPAALYGRGGADLLIANQFAGPSNVYGGTGNDRIQGSEFYSDGLEGGSGNDRIRAREAQRRVRDTVRCGPGFDTAIVDRLDRVSGCERVLRSG
jgi:Ca2+-binding RTX toxin-like protein